MQKKNKTGKNLKQFSEQELRDALFQLEDVMDRALLGLSMIAHKDTAKAMKDATDLYGDGIDFMVEAKYINENTIGVLKSIRDSEHLIPAGTEITDKGFEYEYRGVPIRVKFIHRSYPWFKNLDGVFYATGNYKVPNPFENYWKARHIVI
jgi:hypothetical protein